MVINIHDNTVTNMQMFKLDHNRCLEMDGQRDTEFRDTCLELSRNTPEDKLIQLKFLLQDVAPDINIHDQKLLVDLIRKLEALGIVDGDTPGQDEALLLCEMFDAVSLPSLAGKVRSQLQVQKGIYLCKLNCYLSVKQVVFTE